MRVKNPGGAGRSDHHGHVPHQAVSADQVADLRAAMDRGTATLPKLTTLQFSLDAAGLMVWGGFEPGCKVWRLYYHRLWEIGLCPGGMQVI